MNSLSIISDSWYFSRRNLAAIIRLCLPLVILEVIARQILDASLPKDASPSWEIIVGLLFYPLYSAALILFMSARSNGGQPRTRDLLATSVRVWPRFAVLTGLTMLLILLGFSLMVLPGIVVMVRLAFCEYLLVLRGQSPLTAMRASFELTRGRFWTVFACLAWVMVPLWGLDGLILLVVPEDASLGLSVPLDCLTSFLQLFTSVVMFRLFMLVDQ